MLRNSKKVKKVVSLLTDPKPEFVSLVNHGANQTPFLSVKRDRDVPETLSVPVTTGSQVQKSGDHAVGVLKFSFDKKVFPNEESVRTYMDNKNYSEYTILDAGKTFEIQGGAAEDFDDEVEPIPATKGVVMHVARVRNRVAKREDTQTVSAEAVKAAPQPENTETASIKAGTFDVNGVSSTEIAKKYDSYYTMFSDGKTVAEVIAEGSVDGLPLGFYDVANAFTVALQNALMAGDTAAARALGTEFMDIILKLDQLFKSRPELAEKMMTKVDVTAQAKKDDGSAAMGGTEPNVPSPIAVTEKEINDPGFKSEVASIPDPATSASPIDGPTIGTQIAVSEGSPSNVEMTPITTETLGIAFKSFGDSFAESFGKMFKDSVDKQNEKLTDLATRMTAVENQSQTRKGADIDGGPEAAGTVSQKSAEQIKKEATRSERNVRNRLGF